MINSTLFTTNLSVIKYGRLSKNTKKIKFLEGYLKLVNSKMNSPNGAQSGEDV